MIKDEKAQISAELILLVGALLVVVIVAGAFVFSMSSDIAGNVSEVIDAGRDTSINRL
ncbi:MAG: class III signal peptide-containing protein [Methanobacterium sp.]|nr:class III signal peptide-containing protein [Methanobacterium sp.]